MSLTSTSAHAAVTATDTAVHAFLASAQAAFAQATARAGLNLRHLCVGGKFLRLEFAGPALVHDHMRALAHLEIPDAAPDLTVCLWDSVSTGIAMPSPPWSEDAYLPDERIDGYWTEEVWITYNMGSGLLTLLDRRLNRAMVWLHDAAAMNVYARAMPLRNLLEWWMAGHNRYILHCAAVGSREAGILLVGQGGSGKSTTALNCLPAGLGYLGDDQCLVEVGATPRVYSLYNTGRIASESLARAPGLPPSAGLYPSGDEMKLLYYFHETHADKLTTSAPLKALVHPRVTGGQTPRLVKARPSAIMLGLTPIALPHDAGVRRELIAACGALTRTLPCYMLELSEDSAANIGLIGRLLAAGGNL